MNADNQSDNRPVIEEDFSNGSPLAMVCACGLPMSPNPHPMAGSASLQNDYGYAWECIPCLVQTRNRVGRMRRAVSVQNENLRLALSRGWTLAQYEYADEHGLWAAHAGDGTADEVWYPGGITDHVWVGISGHPDDDECSICGDPEAAHLESSR